MVHRQEDISSQKKVLLDKVKIEQIASNLGIESIELRTRDSADVKEYLQELEFNIIKLEFPEEFKLIDNLIKNIYNKKIQELKNRKLLFAPPTKTNILQLQGKIMSSISSGNKHFNILVGASVCAQAIKLSHLIELFETQTLYTTINYIKSMFDQASKNQSKAVQNIIKNKDFNQAYMKINELLAKNLEHPKLLELKSLIEEEFKEKKNKKIIIFSQYRDTIVKICKTLNEISEVNAKVFVGQAKRGETGLSQKEQQEILEEFKLGKINVLVSSSIGEEGLDIIEVNSVIFYEPIPSAIRSIQRRGRTARLMKGKLTILLTLDTLDEIFYYASRSRERKMYKSIESIKNDLADGKSIAPRKPKQETLF